ncbi:MAG TPA: hypothetical protein VK337_19590 [Xanthobacteraceae bacterium]|nr:hypothetical protein [Xanthobacteraceae bacterium]
MSNQQSTAAVCPCGTVVFPQVICNLPDLPAIAYRIGDFNAFRYQLLQPLQTPPETELTVWRPGAEGDLAVQMMEWWAYVGDILTFYNERIANESYLRTALLPESVNHLVQLLGYRPKPALGARATLAALLTPSARPPLTLPAGLQIQSKPGPGASPQIFELNLPTMIGAPDVVTMDVVPTKQPLLDTTGSTLWLAGKVTGLKLGDRFLLINMAATTAQTIKDYAWINLTGTTAGQDPLGNPVTQVAFSTVSGSIADGAQARNHVLLRSQQASPLWGYSTQTVHAITAMTMDLASVARNVTAGSLLLVDVADGAAAALAAELRKEADVEARRGDAQFAATLRAEALAAVADLVPTPIIAQSYSEVVWYANGDGPNLPPPSGTTVAVPAIAIPHAEIGFVSGSLPGTLWSDIISQINVRWGFSPVGQLVPVGQSSDFIYPTGGSTLVAAPTSANVLPTTSLPVSVLVEDSNGTGAATTVTASGTPLVASLGALTPNPSNGLASPIDIFFGLLGVSRGKSVPSETLGSGNPTVAGQDFTLAQSPVTYFFDPASVSGNNISSTVKVSVNGVQWQEVQSFYGQPPNAQVFVLREDDQQNTHVTFGDGVNGALLPTGSNNVVATYRYGAGAAAPAAETLTVVLTPTPGLKGVSNPLPPTGGSDADQPSQLRTLAPLSVLTFNRAVSLDDYAAIALTASGVTQAVASFAFDPQAQRPVVTLWIAGDAGAAAAAAAAIAGTAMPNQGLRIYPASAVPTTLSLTYVRDPRYGDAAVQAALTTALVDPDSGLLGTNVVGIGQTIYQSQIAAACLAVAGVTAIQNVVLATSGGVKIRPLQFNVGRRSISPVTPANCSGQSYSPGAGKYFSLPNDGHHLFLTGVTAS